MQVINTYTGDTGDTDWNQVLFIYSLISREGYKLYDNNPDERAKSRDVECNISALIIETKYLC